MSGWALSNLASNPRTHSTIVRCNGPAVFTAVLAQHRRSHWLALRMVVALGNLACDSPDNREIIREVGAIGLLVYCLTDEHADVCERSLIALENLSTNSHANQLEIARAGAIRTSNPPHTVTLRTSLCPIRFIQNAINFLKIIFIQTYCHSIFTRMKSDALY
jgi:hypothetical protein